MSPEWVSATAAAVQAVGSVAAIYAAVRIAVRAEVRASAAEAKSEARVRNAEERAERAIKAQMLNKRQVVLEQIRQRLQPTIVSLDSAISGADAHAADGSTVIGGFESQDKSSIEKLINAISSASDDVQLVSLLEDVRRATDPWKTSSGMSWISYAEGLKNIRRNLESSLNALEGYASLT